MGTIKPTGQVCSQHVSASLDSQITQSLLLNMSLALASVFQGHLCPWSNLMAIKQTPKTMDTADSGTFALALCTCPAQIMHTPLNCLSGY